MLSEFQQIPINNYFPWRQKKNFQMNSTNQMTSGFFPNDLSKQCNRRLLERKRNNVNSSVHSDVTENDPLSTIFRTFFPLFKLVYWKRNFSTYQKRCKDMYFNQIGLLIATLQKKINMHRQCWKLINMHVVSSWYQTLNNSGHQHYCRVSSHYPCQSA